MASIPEFLTQALQAQYGETLAAQILAGYACVRPVTLRVNTLTAASTFIEFWVRPRAHEHELAAAQS